MPGRAGSRAGRPWEPVCQVTATELRLKRYKAGSTDLGGPSPLSERSSSAGFGPKISWLRPFSQTLRLPFCLAISTAKGHSVWLMETVPKGGTDPGSVMAGSADFRAWAFLLHAVWLLRSGLFSKSAASAARSSFECTGLVRMA